MLLTADPIERQLRQELAMKEEGERRLKARTLEAEQRAYASSSCYGTVLLNRVLGDLSATITERMGLALKGQAGAHNHVVAGPLRSADPDVLALITLKVMLDATCLPGRHDKVTYTKLVCSIGSAVETELRITWYKEQDPDLANRIQRHFHPGTGTRQKATVFKLSFNREGYEWSKWGYASQVHVGGWLLNCLQHTTGWVYVDQSWDAPKKSTNLITLSDEFYELKDAILERAQSLAWCYWPMLCEPIDWTPTTTGGYLSSELRSVKLIRRSTPLKGPPSTGPYFEMLNRLQKVPYKVNAAILDVAETLFNQSLSVGKFTRQTHVPPPPSPPEGATEDQIKEYKRERRKIEDFNAQIRRNNWRTTEAMFVARKYKSEDRFWIPWNFDYRGRVYPLTHMLHPQGTDFDKSLILFADPGPVDEWWLAFHLANTYGLDKASLDERVAWTHSNYHLISLVASDPIGSVAMWESASEPWCFLAACLEYYECVIQKTRDWSNLPIGIDATCSGLQHLAAMTLDGQAAAMVNVTPSPAPVDGYRIVADRAQELLPEKYAGWMNRKVTKRVVMTTPYGVTRHSARGYIREALREQERELETGDLTLITDVVYKQAMPEVFPGPVAVMQWLQQSARDIISGGCESISWITPSGFPVVQDLRKPLTRRVKTQLLGVGHIRSNVFVGLGDVDVSHHAAALAPNLVHSLDASLLHFAFSECDVPFTLVHDCVYGRSCDMDHLASEVRLHFAEMYKGDPLRDWANQVGVAIPDDLIKNTLDLEQVNQSDYFFC